MDLVAQFPVTIASDDDEEPEESFIISYEPLNNAVVILPTTEVKICGGENYSYLVMPQVEHILHFTHALTIKANIGSILLLALYKHYCFIFIFWVWKSRNNST